MVCLCVSVFIKVFIVIEKGDDIIDWDGGLCKERFLEGLREGWRKIRQIQNKTEQKTRQRRW